MDRINRIFDILRRTVVVALLMSLLWLTTTPMQMAQAGYAPGAPESPSEKQKTLYEGQRNVVNSPGEPATENKSTNANFFDSQGREVDKSKGNNKANATKADDGSENLKNSRFYGKTNEERK